MLRDRLDEKMGFFWNSMITTERDEFDVSTQLLCEISKISNL
jgi:hypothetical protein